ncbi:MAG: cytidylate kinase family protein [Lachnospiraceae bacterium]|nr:cytidylate kinase family protein [Lachnospiraceae bacterium]
MKNLKVRVPMYFIGLFIMTIGIAISVKSNLGVSPVSSIPYTMQVVWEIEMGKATILFHCFLVVLQILLLRKNFKMINLMQIGVGVIFGYFTTFCNWGASFLPTPSNLVVRLLMVLVSTVLVAFGIFLYMPPNIMPLAGEGAMQAVSDVTGIEFPKVKIGFDITMVCISLISCLTFIRNMGSVGIGTILAALLVGTVLGVISKRFGAARDRLLYPEQFEGNTMENTAPVAEHYVITISREYGSGGREIGRMLAEHLGIKYYDLDVIHQVAMESGVSEKLVEEMEQTVKNPTVHSFYYWCTQSTKEEELPIVERIFHAQTKIIKKIAKKESCVIVGRLANYILREEPNCFNIFVGAEMDAKIKRVVERDGIEEKKAKTKIEKVEKERANHCMYFTHKHWRDLRNYDVYVKSNFLGTEKTAEFILQMFKEKYNF